MNYTRNDFLKLTELNAAGVMAVTTADATYGRSISKNYLNLPAKSYDKTTGTHNSAAVTVVANFIKPALS